MALSPNKKLRVGKFSRQGVSNQMWNCYVESGHTIEDIKNPAYWGVITNQVVAFDRIFAVAEDGSWCAELIVTAVEPTWIAIFVLKEYKLSAAEDFQVEGALTRKDFDVSYIAGTGFRVLRKSDKQMIKDGCATKNEANLAIDTYIKTVTGS